MNNSLLEHRERVGWSQAEMAERAGISRQAYSAIESGRSVPSTEVSLRLASAFGVAVERLFWLDDVVRTVEAECVGDAGLGTRVRLASMRGRRVAVPLSASDRLAVPADGVVAACGEGAMVTVSLFQERPAAATLVVAGCDPAFGIVAEALRGHGEEPVWLSRGSRDALDLLARGEVHVAGAHLRDAAGGEGNAAWVRTNAPFPCTRVTFAMWEQSLLVAPGNPRGVGSLSDLAEAGLVLSNREEGSGSRMLLDAELAQAGIPAARVRGYGSRLPGHLAVAESIAGGLADGGVAISAAGRALGLHVIPLVSEHYELIIPDHHLDLPPVARLLELLGRRSLRRQVEALGGYDVSEMGTAA